MPLEEVPEEMEAPVPLTPSTLKSSIAEYLEAQRHHGPPGFSLPPDDVPVPVTPAALKSSIEQYFEAQRLTMTILEHQVLNCISAAEVSDISARGTQDSIPVTPRDTLSPATQEDNLAPLHNEGKSRHYDVSPTMALAESENRPCDASATAAPQKAGLTPATTENLATTTTMATTERLASAEQWVATTTTMARHGLQSSQFEIITKNDPGILKAFASQVASKLSAIGLAERLPNHKFVLRDSYCLPEWFRSPFRKLLEHAYTNVFVTFIIVANGACMAIQADVDIKRVTRGWKQAIALQLEQAEFESAPTVYWHLSVFFAVAFTLEWVCRMMAYDFQFYIGVDALWNWLDTVVVCFSWIDVFSEGSDAPPLRMVRLIRILRAVQVIRYMRFFTELRLVLLSIVHGVMPLFWCILALLFAMFLFSNTLLQILILRLGDDVNVRLEGAGDWFPVVERHFGSFTDCMIALWGMVSGGLEWYDLVQALKHFTNVGAAVIVVYTGFVVIGALNVITAVFVERSVTKAKHDQYISWATERDARDEMAARLIEIFHHVDVDQSGSITLQKWLDFLSTDAGTHFLALFDVEHAMAKKVFNLLDLEMSGQVDIEEFVMGFLHHSGSSNKMEFELSVKTNKEVLKIIKSLVHDNSAHWAMLWERFGTDNRPVPQMLNRFREETDTAPWVPLERSGGLPAHSGSPTEANWSPSLATSQVVTKKDERKHVVSYTI